MIKIKYLDKATGEIKENNYNTNDENRALEIYRREISINPTNYSIQEIINIEEVEQQKTYEQMKENTIIETIKEIKKIVKSLIKKPYNSKNERIFKTIEIKNNVTNKIIKEIEKISNKASWENGYIVDDKIEIYINSKSIQIGSTAEYYNNQLYYN